MGAVIVKSVEWKNKDNILRGSLHLTKRKGAPWFIFSHGFTGHRIGPGYLFVRLSRILSQEGFSSLRFDFAGAGESDGEFCDMTIDSMKSDLLSAVRMIRRRYAPSRLILAGHSLGGMIAAVCTGGAAVDGLALLSPVADPNGLIHRRREILSSGPNRHGYYENGPHEMSLRFLDGLRSIDPVACVKDHFRGRMLVVQGDSDPSITVNESSRYVVVARQAGLPVVHHVIRNADHNYARVSHIRDVFSTVSSWAKGFLG